jgi:hypothetical protein
MGAAPNQEIHDMRRAFAAILIVALLAIGGGIIATTAYQAGLAANVTVVQAGTDGTTGAVVAPVVVPGYGYGYGWGWHGFGFFGFLGALFFLFLLFGLIRFAIGGGRRGWGGKGWYGPGPGGAGYGGPGQHGGSPWESRAHQTFEDWHRSAHSDPASGPATSAPVAPAPTPDDSTPGPRA